MTQSNTDTGQKLCCGKGLCQVIFCAQTEPLYLVVHICFCREKDHGNSQWADIIHQFKAVDAGQHHVQEHQVKLPFLQQVGGLYAVFRTDTEIPCVLQAHPDEIQNGSAVFHSQYFVHRTAPPSPFRKEYLKIASELYPNGK